MRISRSTGYAILAAGYIAKNQVNGIVLSQSISKEYNIPLEYLLKILQQLVRADVLHSKRGPRGGFTLAKPAKKISFLQVIEAVDGPIAVEQAPKEPFCAKAEKIYEKAVEQSKILFEKSKISDLLE